MNEGDIVRIEKATNCTLPCGYRKLLLSFPPELKAVLGLEPRDARLLFKDTATIIKWNKFFRSPEYEYDDSYGEICTFPSNHIVIGANAGGDFFHLDAKRKGMTVPFWCHEVGEISKHKIDLASFIHKIFETTASLVLDGLDLS
jgi:hypothetical protein